MKKLEIVTDGLLILVSAVGLIGWGSYLIEQHQQREQMAAMASRDLKVGQPAKIPGIPAGKKTLVLGIKPGCPWCAEDMPIYQSLHSINSIADGSVAVVDVLPPGPPTEAANYLSNNKIPGSLVLAQAKDYPFMGTPTLVLVDEKGLVVSFWKGSLSGSPDKVRELKALL